jgi:hypothetical protein
MVKMFEKEKIAPKIASQHQNKPIRYKEANNSMDEKVEYARRTHIKSGIGYKTSDKHNSRVNTYDRQFIKFIKDNTHQEKQNTKNTNNVSYVYNNTSHVFHTSYHNFDGSYVLMRNKLGKVIVLHVGSHHKG